MKVYAHGANRFVNEYHLIDDKMFPYYEKEGNFYRRYWFHKRENEGNLVFSLRTPKISWSGEMQINAEFTHSDLEEMLSHL